MKLRLQIVQGAGEGKTFIFTKVPVRVGRGSENDLVLNDDGISRKQFEIMIEATGVMLRDLESSNGTRVNDVIATETELKPGDMIKAGPVTFEVLEIDATAEIRVSTIQLRDARQLERDRVAARAAKIARATENVRPAAKESKLLAPALAPMADGPQVGTRAPTRNIDSTRAALARAARRFINVEGLKDRRTRSIAMAGLALTTVIALIAIASRERDRSGEIFVVDKPTAALAFGKGNVDINTPDRVSFSFESNRGLAELTYAVASVERRDQVEIVVNGERVGYAPQTTGGWTTGLRLAIPRRLLRQGHNIVTFDNLDIPVRPGITIDDRWGIGEVMVTETTLPKVDLVKAKQFYDLGKAAFETRSIAPQNLTRAIAYLEEAGLYVASADETPAIAETIQTELSKVENELQTTYDHHIFTAEQALRFGDPQKARDALREILRYFPDPNDPHHQRAKEKLTELSLSNTP
ncbi:MAG: FHA domain-containing protein [Clostridia bacterium]|nr:FHA domain-containing protein [Deltaproteobacteria bacterium]